MKNISCLILFSFLFCTTEVHTYTPKTQRNNSLIMRIMALRNQLTASNEEKTDDEWKK